MEDISDPSSAEYLAIGYMPNGQEDRGAAYVEAHELEPIQRSNQIGISI